MYRTRTYIAGDWTGDYNLISELYRYNNSEYYNLSFVDAHDLIQSSDTSLNCSIKKSLCKRMDRSKTFVLIVGNNTANLRAGNCYLCEDYHKIIGCWRGESTSNKSYIEYECDKAFRDDLRIVVIYNSTTIQKSKCPDILKNYGDHIPGYYIDMNGKKRFNYGGIIAVL